MFVPADTELPPSRGRWELELGEGGVATEGGPGRRIVPRPAPGGGSSRTTTNSSSGVREGEKAWRARVVSAGGDRLVLDRRSLR